MAKHDAPRSLLFLSVDLTGSTQYKQSAATTDWQRTFLQFYREFPQCITSAQAELKTDELEFLLWKPIGDELLFQCRVSSEADVYRAVRTWILAMDKFEAEMRSENRPLRTKGGAFIATLPGPDGESTIPIDPRTEKSDGDLITLNKAALSGRRRHSTYMYDYFGPSIDTGFRVISKCTQRYFSLSVEVAYAMTSRSVNPAPDKEDFVVPDIHWLGAFELKGVWSGREYPVFAIDRESGDKVHTAMRRVSNGTVSPVDALELCAACYSSDGWPFLAYLPDAANTAFHVRPVNPWANHVGATMQGAEEFVQDEPSDATSLPADAPLGV